MKTSMVAPELRDAPSRTPTLPMDRAPVRRLVRALGRRLPVATVPGVALDLPESTGPGVRVYRPNVRRTDAALLWIHGGGLIIGDAVQDDRLCSATARDVGMTVVSAEYRLAPEHPFPAALDDCHAGWAWVRDNADALGVAPDRVVVGGQSAGGGIAACLAQRLHDEPGPPALAQWLFAPMLDDRTATRRDLDAARHRVWNNRLNRFGWHSYLDAEPGVDSVAPYAVAARRADLSGLTPAWIGVGDIDLFADEDRAYAERLAAAGVDAVLHTVAGAPHGFEAWAPESALARAYVATAQAWLRQAIDGGRTAP